MTLPLARSATLALALAAGPALADITPAQLWEHWQERAGAAGRSLEAGDIARDGGTLTLTDIALRVERADGASALSVPRLVLEPADQGRVRILAEQGATLALASTAPDGAPSRIDIALSGEDLRTLASGDPGAVDYAVAATTLTARVEDAELDAEPYPLEMTLALGALEGALRPGQGDDRRLEARLGAGTVTLEGDVPEAEPGQGGARFASAYSDVDALAALSPAPARGEAASASGGWDFTLDLTHSGGRQRIEGDTPEGPFAITLGSASGALGLVSEGANVSYDLAASEIDLAFAADAVPGPRFEATIARSRLSLAVPLAATDELQPVALHVELDSIAPSERIWTMIDPDAALARDPATLVLDLTGTARQGAATPLEGAAAMPSLLLRTLSLNALRLDALGAELTGAGALSFPDDPAALPPPAGDDGALAATESPEGRIDLRLEGSDGLIATLVDAGLIPQDQAMAARLMLGLFTSPAEDGDAVTTTLEFGADGSVTANGQRIR